MDMFEDVLVIDLSGGRLVTPRIIGNMEGAYIVPAHIDVRNNVPFCDLLMIDVIYNFAAWVIHSYADPFCLRHTGQEQAGMIGVGIQGFDDKSKLCFFRKLTTQPQVFDYISRLVVPMELFIVATQYDQCLIDAGPFLDLYSG